MKVSRSSKTTAFFCLLVGALAVATPGSAQKDRFDETTNVTVVEVPVEVSVSGEPLKTLRKEDFEILDNGKRQDIIGFDVVDLSTVSGPVADIPAAARRHFLVLFDLALSQPDSVLRAREAAAQLVLGALHPTDLVAVATYSSSKGAQLVLGFTPDRNQIRQAITTLGLAEPVHRIADPLGLVIGDIGAELPQSPSIAGSGAAGLREILQDQQDDLGILQSRAARDQQKNRALDFTSNLELIAKMMASVEGRKHVLLLSEGMDNSILTGVQSDSNAGQERAQEIAQSSLDGEYWEIDNDERYGDSRAMSGLNAMLENFRRANCSIQAVDIAGLVAGGTNTNNEVLLTMAKDTGGGFYANYNDLGDAMSEMLKQTSVTYLLAFQPKKLKFDGKYHTLKVKVDNVPSNARVNSRPGYYPPTPYDQMSPLEKRLRSAQEVVGGAAGGGVGSSVLTAAFEIPGQKAYAPVMVEIDGKSLLEGSTASSATIEIYAYALDSQGSVRGFFARRIGLDLTQAGDALREKGFKYWGHFDLDPGDYNVRVLVRNDESGHSGVATSELTVREPQQALLLPPFFPEPFDRWVWGREEEAERRPGAPHPFQYGENPYFPSAVPVLASGSKIPVGVMGYGIADGSVPEYQLLDRAGVAVASGNLEVSQSSDGGAGLSRVDAVLSANKVKSGDYTLVVRQKSASGDTLTSSIPVRVL